MRDFTRKSYTGFEVSIHQTLSLKCYIIQEWENELDLSRDSWKCCLNNIK